MGEERLSDLAIERESAPKFFDYEEVINEFASVDKNQHIVLS